MELLSSKNLIKNSSKDFPGDSVVKNPPANARETGSIPAPGRFHKPRGNLVECAPVPQLESPCSATREATARRSPHTTTRE